MSKIASKDKSNDSTCGFLKLPAELRINIYRYLLPENEKFRVTDWWKRGAGKYLMERCEDPLHDNFWKACINDSHLLSVLIPSHLRKDKYSFSFLNTCRQINSEAASIFFESNAIHIEGSKGELESFICALGVLVKSLREIWLETADHYYMTPSGRLRGKLTLDPETIEINIVDTGEMSSSSLVKEMLTKVEDVVGPRSGKFFIKIKLKE